METLSVNRNGQGRSTTFTGDDIGRNEAELGMMSIGAYRESCNVWYYKWSGRRAEGLDGAIGQEKARK